MTHQSLEKDFLKAYDEHADAIFRFCYAQTGNREHAKDATQEAFVRTWKYLAKGSMIDDMRPFLYRTARNILIDEHRKVRNESLEKLTESGFDIADTRTPDASISAEASRAIRLAAHLNPKYREAVLMRYVDEMQPREIAAIVGESENTISVRIHRGLQQLREHLNVNHES